jgi:hypothetical protein
LLWQGVAIIAAIIFGVLFMTVSGRAAACTVLVQRALFLPSLVVLHRCNEQLRGPLVNGSTGLGVLTSPASSSRDTSLFRLARRLGGRSGRHRGVSRP